MAQCLFSVSGNRENLTLHVALIGSEFAVCAGMRAPAPQWLYPPEELSSLTPGLIICAITR